MSEAGLLVCGFADEASQLAGLVWELPGESAGMLAQKGEITPAETTVAEDGDGVRVRLQAGDLSCDAELMPRTAEVPLVGADGSSTPGEPSSAICDVKVKLSGAGKERAIDCSGHLTRWRASPTEGAEVVRHLAMPAPDGALLVVASRREPGGAGHDTEHASAWLLDANGEANAFAETLLSTQYDQSGRQTRAGLELWPADSEAQPLRAAGTALGGQVANGERVTAALLHSSADGAQGLGDYLIWRS